MKLFLEQVCKTVGATVHLHSLSLNLAPKSFTVLLGATLSGKTSLMRIMAGLDAPTSGAVWVDGIDVTRFSVRQRNVSMVYQQFINYPSMTVAENIAAPMRLRNDKNIEREVLEIAERLRIQAYLNRFPSELSGGQQQRVALARAMAKKAPLMLLDEPLVNLDYKLREELREELTGLDSINKTTVVYATTDPVEALLLGGCTAVMDKGELLQYGNTAEVFHRPINKKVALAFSDPPMNIIKCERVKEGVRLSNGEIWNLDLPSGAPSNLELGIRAGWLRELMVAGDVCIDGLVELAEIAGSDTYVHVKTEIGNMVAQLTGVHDLRLKSNLRVYLNPSKLFVFDTKGKTIKTPEWNRGKFDVKY